MIAANLSDQLAFGFGECLAAPVRTIVFPGSSPGAYFCRGRNSAGRTGLAARVTKKCFILRPRNSGANAQPFGFGASKKSRGREIIPSVTAPFALPSQVRNPSPRSRRSARSGAPGGDVPGTPPPADSPKAAPSAGSAPAKSVLPTKNELSLSDALQPSALPPEFSPWECFECRAATNCGQVSATTLFLIFAISSI